jgi:Holliday junction resolvase RusA-like endonuclease
METLYFFIPGEPIAKQGDRSYTVELKEPKIVTAKNGNNRTVKFINKHYQPKKIKHEERNIRWAINAQLPKNFTPIDVAFEVTIIFVFSALKSFKSAEKEAIQQGNLLIKDTKPDVDNLIKMIFDAMQQVVFLNDARAYRLTEITKAYGSTPGIFIKLITSDNGKQRPIIGVRKMESLISEFINVT